MTQFIPNNSKDYNIINENENFDNSMNYNINIFSKYIISTSGRIESCQRYKKLLSLLQLNINYLPISNNSNSNSNTDTNTNTNSNNKINPIEYCHILRGLPCLGGAISKDIKQSIVSHLDYVDPIARKYNSINTVLRIQPGCLIINTTNINTKPKPKPKPHTINIDGGNIRSDTNTNNDNTTKSNVSKYDMDMQTDVETIK